MDRRMKVKHGSHTRSKSFSEAGDMGSNQMHRQATYDDSQTRTMEVPDQDVWMNSFSSWKMKRMKATFSERDRKAERDEVEETHEKLRRRKNKTFREIVEEKQRREKMVQSDNDDDDLGAGEITNILADLPSTNLDSDNEQERPKSPPVMEEMTRVPRLERQRREERPVPVQRKELRQSLNTIPTNNPMRGGSVKRAPPPVKPKPSSRRGSLQDGSNSVEQNLMEPEMLTTTDSRSTYSAPQPSMRRASEINPATYTRSTYSAPPASEVIPATYTKSTYSAPPPSRRPASEVIPTTYTKSTYSAPPHSMKPASEVIPATYNRSTYSAPPSSRRPASEVIPATYTKSTYAAPTPAVRSKSPPTARRRESEPVGDPVSFHDKLLRARQHEKEADEVQYKAKEAARKPYKPKVSSIFAKIRAFDTGEAFSKGYGKGSTPRVEETRKPDTEEGDFEDMVIIMSQRARSQRGFGFKTSGGYDEKKPLVVSSVSTGSVADYSDLQVGDEILSINKENTRRFNQDDVHQCLSQSILTGKLTCKVRRYPDGKPTQKNTAVNEPVFQRSNPSKQESLPPPVQRQPPPVQSEPPPPRQPIRTSQPPVERVTAPPKQEEPVEADIDVLRPGPTKNALARARQMLDDLEMSDKDYESLESSSKSSDVVDSSSVPPTNRVSNKLLFSQPIKTNGYLSHSEVTDVQEKVLPIQGEEEESNSPLLEFHADKQEEDWAPNPFMEMHVGTSRSLQESEDMFPPDGPQMSFAHVDPAPGVVFTDSGLNKSFSESEDFDDNDNGVAPLNLASDEGADRNSMDDESVSSEDSRKQTERYRPNLQERVIRHTPTSSQDEGSIQEFKPKPAFRSVSAPKPYQSKAPEPYQPPSSRDMQEPTVGHSGMNQRRNEFFPDEDGKDKPFDEMDNLWKRVEDPVLALDEETSEMVPSNRSIKPSTAHRKPFNREEERKRLERWNEEQDRRRQEKYQQEQQRLFEEQERTLQVAAEDVQKKREEEERSLEERRRTTQRQQDELRQIRQEEENRRKARLEKERREREEAERERKEAEERREKENEEERRKKETMERERILRESAEKERLSREKEEEERRERLQREREQREKAAREKMRKEQEEYAKMLMEREKEKREQERMRAEAEQKRQEDEEVEQERQEIEKWRLEGEEREKAAKLKAENDTAMQQEARRKFETTERERIRAEERENMRKEWEEERKRDLEQLRLEKEELQKQREEMAKRQEEDRKKLLMEMGRIKKETELEQENAPVLEAPISQMTNGVVMSAPKHQMGMSHSQRNRHSPQSSHSSRNSQSPRNGQSPITISPGTQRTKENNQKNMLPERDQPPSHSIMSQYKDPNIPTSQHWLVEEAERRRRAEDQGIERRIPPDVVIPPHNDLQVQQKPIHSRHPNSYPRGFDQEIPTRLPAQKKQSHEAPASTNAVQRRLRKPEAEAERQKTMMHRRSLPDLTVGRDDVVPHTEQTNNPSRGDQTTPYRVVAPNNTANTYSTSFYIPRGFIKQPQSSAASAASSSGTVPREQMYESEHPSYTARTATATRPAFNSQRYNYSGKDLNTKPRPFSSYQTEPKYKSDF